MATSSKNKLKSVLGITALAAASLHVINKAVFASAVRRNYLNSGTGCYYNWRLGNIFYQKTGSGKPLLLIHDLHSSSSSYEWNQTIKHLSENYTVYALDLIGCGRSDKPHFTYTNYLYVQLISDFIKHVIGQKTDVAATGLSASFVIMACSADSELFNRLLLINPVRPASINWTPAKYSRTLKLMLELPIWGTFLYNINVRRTLIQDHFYHKYFASPKKCSSKHIQAYHESAHLGGPNARFLFASLKGGFLNINIKNALRKINNSIILIHGEKTKSAENIRNDYTILNPAIETAFIPDTQMLPQLEAPEALAAQIKLFLQ